MAVFDSPVTSYSDTTPIKRIITDVISLIDPSDTPAIDAVGGLDGAASKFRFVNGKGKLVEWLEDTLIPISDALTASITGSNTVIGVTDASLYQKGQLIQVENEICWVSAVDTAGDSCTIVRAQAGTATASHAATCAVQIVGMARLEGADSDPIALADIYTGSNVTQIFHQEVKVTRTAQQIAQYGIADELEYQANKAVPQLVRLIERQLYRSKGASAGTATTPRIMGGFQAFVTTNKVSGATLAQSQFENAVKAAFGYGGGPSWVALVSPTNLQKVKNFYDASTFLRVTTDQTSVGLVVDQIRTPFGNVGLVLDRWATDTEINIIDPSNVGMLTLYPFTREMLAKTGDADKAQVVGEFTLCVRQNASHALLTNVS